MAAMATRRTNAAAESTARFSMGIDYGTNSVRALIVDVATGEEVAEAVCDFASGEAGVLQDARDPNLARQNPADYIDGFLRAAAGAVQKARARKEFDSSRVVGIGVDTTGSTPIPVDRGGTPLGMVPEFKRELAAQAWLWKDHTAHAEAEEITHKARDGGFPYLAKCGGAYSSEWYWAKMLHCERTCPKVARAAYSWVECADFIPAYLTGKKDPQTMARGICAAGHKGMYHPQWGGWPSAAFLESLEKGFSRYRERLAATAVPADRRSGELTGEIAARVGLPPGIPVAVGAIDAHLGAVGSGVGAGTLVAIMGTSTCCCMVAPMDRKMPDVPGLSGIVLESIIPGMYGLEAGQAAVGDLFNWYVNRIDRAGDRGGQSSGLSTSAHTRLADEASRLRPGESGLVALDWNNGNRSLLTDPVLTGLLVGQTLATTPGEIYRALIEATAFGARMIVDRLEEYGIRIERVIGCGGIAEKNPLAMQIYADVFNRPMMISRSQQTCALGAAIFGAVVGGAHGTVQEAQKAMTGVKATAYRPVAANVEMYRRLFAVYKSLHDAFGTRGWNGSLAGVMKELIELRRRVRGKLSAEGLR